jgi:GNAT superfamily N-acetyltransferase
VSALARFPMDADELGEARRYLENRAVQAVIDGWKSERTLEVLREGDEAWGLWGRVRAPSGEWHQTFYVLRRFRAQGRASRLLRERGLPVVTTPDCQLDAFLQRHALPFVAICHFTQTPEYRAIAAFYGARCAERSRIPWMNHVDEGLAVLRELGASDAAKRAYCLHPLVQGDAELTANLDRLDALGCGAKSWVLASEYRRVANLTLSHREVSGAADIPLGPLPEVHDMLRADKVQNEKDFLLAHATTHPRRDALRRYFQLWLERLGVDAALKERCHRAMSPWV